MPSLRWLLWHILGCEARRYGHRAHLRARARARVRACAQVCPVTISLGSKDLLYRGRRFCRWSRHCPGVNKGEYRCTVAPDLGPVTLSAGEQNLGGVRVGLGALGHPMPAQKTLLFSKIWRKTHSLCKSSDCRTILCQGQIFRIVYLVLWLVTSASSLPSGGWAGTELLELAASLGCSC